MDTDMKRVIPLKQFVEYVPGVGMVVAKPARPADKARGRPAREAIAVTITAAQARKRVNNDEAQYADPIGEDGEGISVVREPKTQRERRLAARAARRAGGAKPQLDHDNDGAAGGSKKGADSTASKGARAKKGASKNGEAELQEVKDVTSQFAAGGFFVFQSKAYGIGGYLIRGPTTPPEGLTIKGKAKVQAKLDELNAVPPVTGGQGGGSSDAPVD